MGAAHVLAGVFDAGTSHGHLYGTGQLFCSFVGVTAYAFASLRVCLCLCVLGILVCAVD